MSASPEQAARKLVRDARIYELALAGWSNKQIALELGVSPSHAGAIYNIFRKAGATPPTRDRGASAWSAQRVAMLRQLHADGLSASQIAKQLGGLTRNSVISKLHRLGLRREMPAAPRLRAQPVKREPKRSAQPVQPRPPPPRPAPVARAEPPPRPTSETARPWLTRMFGECAFPVDGTGADTLSCCAQTGGKTYCTAHRATMFRPRPPKPVSTRPAWSRVA